MVHKLALVTGGLAALGVLALYLASAGFSPALAGTKAASDAAAPVAAAALAKTVTDTVYVKPVPAAQIIHVTKPARGPDAARRGVTVSGPARHDDDGPGGEGAGNRGERGND